MAIFYKNTRIRIKRNTGFTLIEVLIVIAILGIVAGSILGNFFTSLGKGRDSRRKQDLELVGKSLELYYNDHKAYPTGDPLSWGNQFTDGTTVYMQQLPTDPKSPSYSYNYVYDPNPPAGGGSGYKLYACLENKNDSSKNYKATGYAGSTCANCVMPGNLCSYGIASFNTTP